MSRPKYSRNRLFQELLPTKCFIGQQVNNDWYYLSDFEAKNSHSTPVDLAMVELIEGGWLSGMRYWTNDTVNAFNFENRHVTQGAIRDLFGVDGHKQYVMVAGT